ATYQVPVTDAAGNPVKDAQGNPKMQDRVQKTQSLPMGPIASQEAIKELGTNGGGFLNANSAHPYENPTPFTNFLEMLAIMLISGGLCFTFGETVGDQRQGWVVFLSMALMLVLFLAVAVYSEQKGTPGLAALGA